MDYIMYGNIINYDISTNRLFTDMLEKVNPHKVFKRQFRYFKRNETDEAGQKKLISDMLSAFISNQLKVKFDTDIPSYLINTEVLDVKVDDFDRVTKVSIRIQTPYPNENWQIQTIMKEAFPIGSTRNNQENPFIIQ